MVSISFGNLPFRQLGFEAGTASHGIEIFLYIAANGGKRVRLNREGAHLFLAGMRKLVAGVRRGKLQDRTLLFAEFFDFDDVTGITVEASFAHRAPFIVLNGVRAGVEDAEELARLADLCRQAQPLAGGGGSIASQLAGYGQGFRRAS